MWLSSARSPARIGSPGAKKTPDPDICLAQEAEIQDLITAFREKTPEGNAVAELEVLVRAAIFKPANELVGMLLQQAANRIDAVTIPKKGEVPKGREPLLVKGMFGTILLMRQYYYHPGKKCGRCPADAGLGLEGGYTPALARLICLEGGDETSFVQASLHLWEVGGISVSERQIQRVVGRIGEDAVAWQKRESPPGPCDAKTLYISADASGVPMRREELVGSKGKAPDGKAKTRMAMLGCVFTQHTEDAQGRPLRDHDSTTYLSGFQSPSDFGISLRREAIRRGLFSVAEIVLLIDGATGLEKLGRDYFPGAVQIVDFYHALEHLQTLIETIWGKGDEVGNKRRRHYWKKLLAHDGVDRIIKQARKEAFLRGNVTEVETALGYFVNNVSRMQYGTFRAKNYFIGSGVIEAGCRTIIGKRCKQSGMFWGESGADKVLAFRCIQASRRLDDFWKYRLNSHSAENDSLALAA